MNSFAWDKFRKQQATEREQLQRLLSGIHGLLARCLTTASTEIELSALAALLHSFYTGVENIFKRVAVELDSASVLLSAEGTTDPNGNSVRATWWIYPEAGNISGATLTATNGLRTEIHLPQIKKTGKLHVILQVEDDGEPPLFAYRRAIIEVGP